MPLRPGHRAIAAVIAASVTSFSTRASLSNRSTGPRPAQSISVRAGVVTGNPAWMMTSRISRVLTRCRRSPSCFSAVRPICVMATKEGVAANPHTAAADSWLNTASSPTYNRAAVSAAHNSRTGSTTDTTDGRTRCSDPAAIRWSYEPRVIPSARNCDTCTSVRWAAAISANPRSPVPRTCRSRKTRAGRPGFPGSASPACTTRQTCGRHPRFPGNAGSPGPI